MICPDCRQWVSLTAWECLCGRQVTERDKEQMFAELDKERLPVVREERPREPEPQEP